MSEFAKKKIFTSVFFPFLLPLFLLPYSVQLSHF